MRLKRRHEGKEAQAGRCRKWRRGVVQVFRRPTASPGAVGVVGPLQLDVLTRRLAAEYGLPVEFDQSEFQLHAGSRQRTGRSSRNSPRRNRAGIADDLDGDLVYLAAASSIWTHAEARPGIVFTM